MGILIVVAVLAFGGWTAMVYQVGGDQREASVNAKQLAAETKVKEQADEIIAQGKQGIEDRRKAYEDGQAHGRVVIQTVTARAAADVARYPVFQNAQCVLPTESLALLNAARGSLRSGVLPDIPPPGPDPATPSPPPAVALPAAPPPSAKPPAPISRGLNHPKPKPVTR